MVLLKECEAELLLLVFVGIADYLSEHLVNEEENGRLIGLSSKNSATRPTPRVSSQSWKSSVEAGEASMYCLRREGFSIGFFPSCRNSEQSCRIARRPSESRGKRPCLPSATSSSLPLLIFLIAVLKSMIRMSTPRLFGRLAREERSRQNSRIPVRGGICTAHANPSSCERDYRLREHTCIPRETTL